MYNLLKGKSHFWCFDSIAWKTGTYLRRRRCFVLTNAPASIRMGSIAELAQNWLHNHSC
jgi:enoyl-[acyl-carrier protein] reductase I